jgi:hypothetical protein
MAATPRPTRAGTTSSTCRFPHIFGDDNVQILLGTFHSGKQAMMFAVNPLGVRQRDVHRIIRQPGRPEQHGAPIFIRGPDSSLTRAPASRSNLFHVDALLSYQPVPGTVVFAGYGSNMVDEAAFQFRGLTRTDDAFCLKLSHLFRL